MNTKGTIDAIDIKIMDIISKNARMPFKDVAEICGISRAAVHQRVSRLIETKVITGSGYHIDPRRVNFKTCTYMGIFLEKGSLYQEVVDRIYEIPEIVECHYTTGKYSMFIKVYAKDNEHLKEILTDKLQKIDGISSTETIISLEESFRREIPITDFING